MKILMITILMALLIACGSPDLITLPSLSAQQPRVMGVNPKNNSVAAPNSSVSVLLTREIDETTVTKESFLVVANFTEAPASVIEKDVNDGEITGVEGDYSVEEDGFSITFRPKEELTPGTTYGVIITNKVSTVDHFTLPTPFVSKFTVEAASDNTSTNTLNESGGAVSNTEDAEGDESGGQDDEAGQVAVVDVVINEILYDATGSDTDGNLFVELRGTPQGIISGYKIVFINGDDGKITESVTLPAGAAIPDGGFYVVADAKTSDTKATNVSIADFISNFDPQNGPDAAQLLDDEEELLDAVCYGNVTVEIAENGLAMCEGEPAPDVASGQSISRADGADSDDNAADFVANTSPSPGE